jgi:hypothetical protein
MVKKIISFVFVACLFLPLVAQKSKQKIPKPPVKITTQQMYEDFDQFLHIIKTYNAQWEIRMEHTGYDMFAILDQRREKIANIKNYWDFINFMDAYLDHVLDVHARRREVYYEVSKPRYAPGQSFYDSTHIAAISTGFNYYLEKSNISYKDWRQVISTNYLNGHYYMLSHFTFINAKTKDTICFQNARVIAYDYQPIDLYVKNQIGNLPPHRIRWDFKQQKYYTDLLAVSFNKTLKVEDETGVIYEFIPNRYGIQMQTFVKKEFRENPEQYYASYKEWEPQRIAYLPKQKILYIYTNMMSWQKDYNLIDSIKKEGMNKPIDKIIIDVRGNKGGGDGFWMNMLSAIIKDTLYFENKVALNYNDETKAYFNAEFPPEMTKEYVMKEIPFLNNKKMLVHDREDYIEPDSNSLQFGGKIYLFQDKDTYSSGHSFTSLARQIPQLVSMGMSTGHMVGFGFNPWGFQLKHSKYTFSFEPAIDLSKAEKWEDTFQCIPEIEVIPSINELNDYNSYRNITELEEFLLTHDYLFKKVLEME